MGLSIFEIGGISIFGKYIKGSILDACVAKGTWTASGTVTIPAVTLGGNVAGAGKVISTLDRQLYNETNLLDNSSFEVGDPPSEWTLYGADITLSRDDTKKQLGSYSLKIVRTGAEDGGAFQDIISPPGAYMNGRTFTLGCWVWCDVANRAGISIHYAAPVYHSGSSTWEWLTCTHTYTSEPIYRRVYVGQISGGVATAYFDGAILVEGDSCPAFSPKPIGTYDAITLRQALTLNAQNLISDIATGTKIGTATNQKLGFFNAIPVVQQTGCAVPTDLATCISSITALRTALNTLGFTTVV